MIVSSLLSVAVFAQQVYALPAPTGPYRVGTRVTHLSDKTRKDPADRKLPRELMIQLWYPTLSKGAVAPYLTDRGLEKAVVDAIGPSASHWSSLKTHSVLNGSPRPDLGDYKVLILSHGLGNPRCMYTVLAEQLASCGYLVVTVDHPGGGVMVLPRGRVLTTADDPQVGDSNGMSVSGLEWAKDDRVVLDYLLALATARGPFRHLVDTRRVGALGHSLGGAAAMLAARLDSRISAVCDLDGLPTSQVEQAGMQVPCLVLRSKPNYSEADFARRHLTRAEWEKRAEPGKVIWANVMKRARGPFYSFAVLGMTHMNYSDAPWVQPATITYFGGVPIGRNRGLKITCHFLQAFFDRYLKGQGSGLPNWRQWPEVSMLAKK